MASRSFHASGPTIRMAMESNSWVTVIAGARPPASPGVVGVIPRRSSRAPVR
jgi:hypothetical protein